MQINCGSFYYFSASFYIGWIPQVVCQFKIIFVHAIPDSQLCLVVSNEGKLTSRHEYLRYSIGLFSEYYHLVPRQKHI